MVQPKMKKAKTPLHHQKKYNKLFKRDFMNLMFNIKFLKNLGNAYGAFKDYQRAISIFKRCLELGGEDSSLRKTMGITYMAMGEYLHAQESFEKIPLHIRKREPEI